MRNILYHNITGYLNEVSLKALREKGIEVKAIEEDPAQALSIATTQEGLAGVVLELSRSNLNLPSSLDFVKKLSTARKDLPIMVVKRLLPQERTSDNPQSFTVLKEFDSPDATFNYLKKVVQDQHTEFQLRYLAGLFQDAVDYGTLISTTPERVIPGYLHLREKARKAGLNTKPYDFKVRENLKKYRLAKRRVSK